MTCLREHCGCVETRLASYTIQNIIRNIFYFLFFNNYKTGCETQNIVSTRRGFNNILSYKFKL